ncbi:MAG: LapA family protein [Burkholderiales bacterium]
MRVRTPLFALVVVLIAAFAALNWSAFTTPTALSLGFSTIEAPLGLLMLGLVLVVVLTFVVYMGVWQGTLLPETRRHAKELQAQRTLAEQAEASRFTELRGAMHEELERLAERIARTQESLRIEIHESTDSLAAMIGEIDDHMKRPGGGDST